MAYEAHKWKIGEEITSEKLNHIEKGIEEAGLPREITDPQDGQTLKYDAESGKWVNAEGGGGSSTLVVNDNNGTLDKTWQEIADAFPNVVLYEDFGNSNDQYSMLTSINRLDAKYYVSIGSQNYKSDSPDGYPVVSFG